MAGVLFEDIFDVKDIDPEGKKFDRVSRLHCESESFKMDLILDVNIQAYPMDLDVDTNSTIDEFRLDSVRSQNWSRVRHQLTFLNQQVGSKVKKDEIFLETLKNYIKKIQNVKFVLFSQFMGDRIQLTERLRTAGLAVLEDQ
ncbi:DNA-directed RNA polymerases I, II, and III subunit RPABC3 [Trichonephila inaurata madagascariensis]|uniref:DNA-directed RNA polymerases I, II, and III subunit RPABC3 n=1 Tax=Trichonephila inaurata madagascariensis TaxID=2747483 RepID=A0A8X6YBM0_9ARAC|nr:DNA-directed RNA polymerases I, II, and III subunit RPABC3 [Trichonephila inaurata madagascariensis]